MKRFLLILAVLMCFLTSSAQTQWYNSQSYAHKYIGYYGWSNWSSWIDCDVNIKFDFNSDRIIIYSNRTQYYQVTAYHGSRVENDGSQQAYFTAIDQDGDRCTIRLRIESNGNSQIYVEFSNVMWVYNVRRIN